MKALDIVTTGKNGFDPNTSQLAIHNTVQSPTAIMDSVPISDFTGDSVDSAKISPATGKIVIKCPRCHRIVEIDLALRRKILYRRVG